MTNELLALIVAHIACADIAEERHLSSQEVQYCSAVYQEIKLAFVPDVTPRSYPHLSPMAQRAANEEGYLAFVTWRRDNPSTMRHLQRVARGELELGQAG